MLARIVKQLADLRAAQFDLEDDLCHKESALGIDNVCHQVSKTFEICRNFRCSYMPSFAVAQQL